MHRCYAYIEKLEVLPLVFANTPYIIFKHTHNTKIHNHFFLFILWHKENVSYYISAISIGYEASV